MHYPLEIPLGPVRLPAHLLFEMLAFTVGYRAYLWQRRRRRDAISDENRLWIFLGAAAGALLGSHLLGGLERPAELAQANWLYWMANKTILGGLLGGLFSVEITKKIIGVRVSSGDLMTYPIMLGLAVGRVGCHFAGLEDGTHGLPSALPWAIDFGDGVPRHPVNIYEILFLGLWAACIYLREQRQTFADGGRFRMMMAGYLCWRFFIEGLKPASYLPIGLSVIQLAALAGLAYYLVLWWRTR